MRPCKVKYFINQRIQKYVFGKSHKISLVYLELIGKNCYNLYK